MRCPTCGNSMADGLVECPRCHESLWALGSTAVNAPSPVLVSAQGDSAVAAIDPARHDVSLPRPSRGEMMLRRVAAVVGGLVSAAQSVVASVIPPKCSVRGRVIIAEVAQSEDPDLDVCKIIARILWVIMLLPFLIGAVAVCFLFRRFLPMNLFATLGILKFLNPAARNTAQVPVRYFRIREAGTDNEVMVRMKGQLTDGNVGQDDQVTISGRSRRGTLYAYEGYNHRTGSTIRVAQSYSWVGLVLTVLLILVMAVKA